MPHHRLLLWYTTYPSSAAIAQTYAANVNRPLQVKLTPLRLAYYAYLLGGGTRLLLNYLFQEAYNGYDLTLAVFTSIATSYMSSLIVFFLILLAFVFDCAFLLRPHPKVAPMLVDLVVRNRGSVKQIKLKLKIKCLKNVCLKKCLPYSSCQTWLQSCSVVL